MNISDESILLCIFRIKADPGLKLTKHQNLYTSLILSKKVRGHNFSMFSR